MARSGRKAAIARLQSAARRSRTALAGRLLDQGLYPGQDRILLELADEEGIGPGALAMRLGVRPPTITKALNRLQGEGFVEKRACEDDGRQTVVFLTEDGRSTLKAVEKSIRKTEKQAFRGLDKKELRLLSKLLARVEANFDGTGPVADDDEDAPEQGPA